MGMDYGVDNGFLLSAFFKTLVKMRLLVWTMTIGTEIINKILGTKQSLSAQFCCTKILYFYQKKYHEAKSNL
jgi:hypothetical protein